MYSHSTHSFQSISVLTWNVNGCLALKLFDASFRATLMLHDVILLQETHLRVQQESRLRVPNGYQAFFNSRKCPATFTQPHGGVAVFVRESFNCKPLPDISLEDTIFVQLGPMVIVNSYCPPENSSLSRANVAQHVTALAESLALVSHRHNDCYMLLAGDLNARTSSRTPPSALPRASPDITVNHHGRQLLQLAQQLSLTILNGTTLHESASRMRYTSFQHNGSSVIDYFLLSEPQLLRNPPPTLVTMLHQPKWSDHAPLVLTIASPYPPSLTPPPHSLHAPTHRAKPRPIQAPAMGTLDVACATLKLAASTQFERIYYLYGPVTALFPVSNVYLAVAKVATTIGVGIFWGTAAVLNQGRRVPGSQHSLRAHLYAFLLLLQQAPTDRSLRIYSTSELLVSTICYSSLRHAYTGWKCEHSDILREIVTALRMRTTSHTLVVLPPDSVNPHYLHAKALAANAVLQGPPTPLLPLPIAGCFSTTSCGLPAAKVHTLLTHNRVTPPSASLPPPPPLGSDGSPQALQLTQLRRQLMVPLTRAVGSTQFWCQINSLLKPRPSVSHTTADALRDVFQRRMNPAPIIPATFNGLHRLANETVFRTIPPPLPLPNSPFTLPITDDDIIRVKTHLLSRDLHSAAGIDELTYDEVIHMPNDLLCELFNTCINSCDAPSSWLSALLVGKPKHNKSPSDPENYRTIGLESCLLKTLTMIIDQRMRDWASQHHIIPPSQNAFQAKRRTNYNALILRTAIETALASHQPLYVAFIDITNAFPSGLLYSSHLLPQYDPHPTYSTPAYALAQTSSYGCYRPDH